MCYTHGQNNGKWSRTDDLDAEPQKALWIPPNNWEHCMSKLGFPNAKELIRKLSAILALTFFNIAITVLFEFK